MGVERESGYGSTAESAQRGKRLRESQEEESKDEKQRDSNGEGGGERVCVCKYRLNPPPIHRER
jgi:hypothetical protein